MSPIYIDCTTRVGPLVPRHTATCGNTRQHAATRCNTLQHAATRCNMLHHAATRCNILQHAATHGLCGRLGVTSYPQKVAAGDVNLPSTPATLCSTLQHIAAHCSTQQHTAAHCSTLQHTHCSTLQHTATHCNTLRYPPLAYGMATVSRINKIIGLFRSILPLL